MLAIVAAAAAVASLALRDAGATALERDGQRLVALLEDARAQSRASGAAVRFELREGGRAFAFVTTAQAMAARPGGAGAPGAAAASLDATGRVRAWDDARIAAHLPPPSPGGPAPGAIVLGPQPLIGPQRVVLVLGGDRLAVITDGLDPFAVGPADGADGPPR